MFNIKQANKQTQKQQVEKKEKKYPKHKTKTNKTMPNNSNKTNQKKKKKNHTNKKPQSGSLFNKWIIHYYSVTRWWTVNGRAFARTGRRSVWNS